jgi:hypothetical protein
MLDTQYKDARENIEKAAAAEAYTISEDASRALAKLVRALDTEHGDLVREVGEHHASVIDCMETIRRCAKKDLGKV